MTVRLPVTSSLTKATFDRMEAFGRFCKRVEPLDQPHSPEELARIEEEL